MTAKKKKKSKSPTKVRLYAKDRYLVMHSNAALLRTQNTSFEDSLHRRDILEKIRLTGSDADKFNIRSRGIMILFDDPEGTEIEFTEPEMVLLEKGLKALVEIKDPKKGQGYTINHDNLWRAFVMRQDTVPYDEEQDDPLVIKPEKQPDEEPAENTDQPAP